MKLMALAKKEAQDILTNRIYMLVVFMQVFIILGAFGLGLASSIITDPSLLDKYGATSTLKVGISEDLKNSSLANDLKAQNLNLIYFKDINSSYSLLGSQLVAIVNVSPPPYENITYQSDTSNVFYPIVSEKIKNAINQFILEKKLESAGIDESKIQAIEKPIILNEIMVNEENTIKLRLNNSYFVEIMYGFMIPFVLLLPFFLASNIVTDSIVGERERKTFEMLLMVPLPSSMVIIGKILPILSFSIIQSVAWITLLDLLGVPIFNPIFMVLLLFFIGLGFIGIGILISMFVDSTKEANTAITLILILVTFILFMPLFIKMPVLGGFLEFIPTIIMIRISSTPILSYELLINFIPTVIISTIIFALAIKYFRHERAIRL